MYLDPATMSAIEADLAAAHPGGVISYTRTPAPPPSNGVYAGLVTRRPPRPRDPVTAGLLGKLRSDLGAVVALGLLLVADSGAPVAAPTLDDHGREIIEAEFIDEDEQ